MLLVVDSLATNGAVYITVELARRWAPDGARLAVLQRLSDVPVVTPPPGVAVVQLSASGARLRFALVRAVPRLVRQARQVDVVVGGSEIGIGFLVGLLAARVARRPFVVAVHADLDDALAEWVPRRLHGLYYWAHRRVNGAVCVAQGLVEPLVRNGLPVQRVHVVRNGIDVAAVQRAARGPGNLVGGDLPVVVATGRLAPQKAYDVLLRAHARIVGHVPHRLLILNDGPDHSALVALARRLRVQDSVQFAGAVPTPLPSVARAAVFCLPSRHEGLPLALLEAIVLGVPVIAADCSEGVRAVLDDGRVGELVPVDDVEALAQALARHLGDGGPLRERALRGPAHATSFDSEVMTAGWTAALVELTLPRHGRSPGRPRPAAGCPGKGL